MDCRNTQEKNWVTKTFQDSCPIDLEVGKQSPKSVIAMILRFIFSLNVFYRKTLRPLCMDEMQISAQATDVLSRISRNNLLDEWLNLVILA